MKKPFMPYSVEGLTDVAEYHSDLFSSVNCFTKGVICMDQLEIVGITMFKS